MDSEKNLVLHLTLSVMLQYADKKGDMYPTVGLVAQRLGIAVRTVQHHRHRLVRREILRLKYGSNTVIPRLDNAKAGIRRPATYVLGRAAKKFISGAPPALRPLYPRGV